MARTLIALTALCLMAVPAPVTAKTVTATYTGVIIIGGDIAPGNGGPGLFGTPGALFNGLGITASYQYDASRFYSAPGHSISAYTLAHGYFERRFGGDSTGAPTSPILDASVTIKGVTRHINPLYYSSLETSKGEAAHSATSAYSAPDTLFGGANTHMFLDNGPWYLAHDFYFAPPPFTFGGTGSFSFGYLESSSGLYQFAAASYFVTGYSVAGAVPEPASWAMLITGFGLVGVAARRQAVRTKVVAI